jgi:hypothetical protein
MRDCPVLVMVQGSTVVVDWWWWHFINIELPGLRQANSRHRLEGQETCLCGHATPMPFRTRPCFMRPLPPPAVSGLHLYEIL